MNYTPSNPNWFNRDRFVLSAGHGSMLLYSLLHLTGYDLSLEDLKNFRQWGSKTPGHPEFGHTPGVDATGKQISALQIIADVIFGLVFVNLEWVLLSTEWPYTVV